MSEGPEPAPAETLAAEYALGVLSAEDRMQAETRMAREPAFAAEVEAWRARLAPLLDEIAPAAAPARVWTQIERMLPANDHEAADLRRRVRTWRRATTGSLALAAASLAAAIIVANKPAQIVRVQVPVEAPMPNTLLNANLASERGQPMFIASYDPARKVLIITSLMRPGSDPDHVHELWIYAADGTQRSLGMVEPGASKRMPMAGDMAPMMAPGGTLAISVEPPGGSPNRNGPSGPVAARGRLSEI